MYNIGAAGRVHTKIFKQIGGNYYRGGGFGGRRYFIIGSKFYFIEAVDWEACS
jgi:hypothetical protein